MSSPNLRFNSSDLEKEDGKTGKNRVLLSTYNPSSNFFRSDLILQTYLKKYISGDAYTYMLDKWERTGAAAAGAMNELSRLADKEGPELEKRNVWGENIDKINFHPSYWELLGHAVDSEMFRVKWEPELRKRFQKESHSLGFAAGTLFCMTELSQFCPLCMTDGVARLIDMFCDPADKARLMPHIYTDQVGELFTGAMFLTEKAGGSDVGANLVEAQHLENDSYYLKGEKWFCSNANADLIFALARTDPSISGTKGLSIFLLEKMLPNGERNPMELVRLKEKLGVRSMASAEIIMHKTQGKLVGEEFRGFSIMAQMINLSRLYNSVAALAGGRRALIEAFQFISNRKTFGRIAIDHALVRDKLRELGAMHTASFYMVWRAIRALDAADNGNKNEGQLLRLLTPMVKKWTAEKTCYLVREAMELMGGMGYIEDTSLPRIMRDVMVLPIWEGAGNIMSLDMLRALFKSEGLEMMASEIRQAIAHSGDHSNLMGQELEELEENIRQMRGMGQDEMELKAKYTFERLTDLFQLAILVLERDSKNKAWIRPSIDYLAHKISGSKQELPLLTVKEIQGLLAWKTE